MKKTSNRSKTKHAALNPRYTLKARQEYLDYDYIDKLDPASKDWLNKFTEEDLHAVIRKDDPNALHQTPEQYKSITDRNNWRNNDLYNKKKMLNDLVPLDSVRNAQDDNQVGVAEGNELRNKMLETLDKLKEEDKKLKRYNSWGLVREFIEKTEIRNLEVDMESIDYEKIIKKLLRSKRLKNLKKF